MIWSRSVKPKKILLWGFCGQGNHVVDELRKLKDTSLWNISDHPQAELNIFDCFRRKMKKPHRVSRFREQMQIHFEVFQETYSRHWYPRSISDERYHHYFYFFIDYFTAIIDEQEFDYAVFANIPHEGPEFIIYHLFKLMEKRTVIFYQSIFRGRAYVSHDLNIFDPQLITPYHENNMAQASLIRETVAKTFESIGNWFYMKRTKISKSFTLGQLKRNARRHFKRNIYLMLKLMMKDLIFFYQYHKFNRDTIDMKKEKYVYFPLHLQPELTTAILGGEFVDQVYALEELAKIVPEDFSIVVKENPYQNGFKRPWGYYDRIKQIKNVKIIPMSYSSIELIQYCSGVATINGTCGWEAICLQRPVLTFGTAWYSKLDGVYSYHRPKEREDFLNFPSRDFKVIDKAIEFLMHYSFEGIVDYDYIKIYPDYDERENSKRIIQVIKSSLGFTDV